MIAATNKDLQEEIRKGTFREDLFFRLNVIPIVSPPLREHPEDIPYLVSHFIEQVSKDQGVKPKSFTRAAVETLTRMPWKGNVRELRNTVERLLIMTAGDQVDTGDLPGADGVAETAGGGIASPAAYATLREFKEAAEKQFIISKLESNDWNISKTAKEIDTPRSYLYKKLELYGLAKSGREREDTVNPEEGEH